MPLSSDRWKSKHITVYYSKEKYAHLQLSNIWSPARISFTFWPPADPRALPQHAAWTKWQKLIPISYSPPFCRTTACHWRITWQTSLRTACVHQQVLFKLLFSAASLDKQCTLFRLCSANYCTTYSFWLKQLHKENTARSSKTQCSIETEAQRSITRDP